MTCPNCGAPMRLDPDKDYLLCEYCGNLHFPDADSDGVRVLGEPAREKCPVCALALMHAAIAGHRIRYCTRCRGMLVTMEAFLPLIQGLRSQRDTNSNIASPPDRMGLKRHIRCPQCGFEMETHPYAGPGNIIIDDCERCELNWLDYGELQRIVSAPDRHFSYPDV